VSSFPSSSLETREVRHQTVEWVQPMVPLRKKAKEEANSLGKSKLLLERMTCIPIETQPYVREGSSRAFALENVRQLAFLKRHSQEIIVPVNSPRDAATTSAQDWKKHSPTRYPRLSNNKLVEECLAQQKNVSRKQSPSRPESKETFVSCRFSTSRDTSVGIHEMCFQHVSHEW